MHRIGGIEKQDGTGNVNYDPDNHEHMIQLRAEKIARIANDIPLVEVDDETGDAELLVLGWGSTWGSIKAAVRRIRAADKKVASAQLIHLNPFPRNLGDVLARVPEGARPRDEPRASCRSCCAPSTSSTRRASPRCRDSRSAPPRSRRRSWR